MNLIGFHYQKRHGYDASKLTTHELTISNEDIPLLAFFEG